MVQLLLGLYSVVAEAWTWRIKIWSNTYNWRLQNQLKTRVTIRWLAPSGHFSCSKVFFPRAGIQTIRTKAVEPESDKPRHDQFRARNHVSSQLDHRCPQPWPPFVLNPRFLFYCNDDERVENGFVGLAQWITPNKLHKDRAMWNWWSILSSAWFNLRYAHRVFFHIARVFFLGVSIDLIICH